MQDNEERPTDIVSDSLRIDLKMKPSSIQGNEVLAAMLLCKSWEEIAKTVKKVTNKKAISNEKIKQRQKLKPLVQDFRLLRGTRSLLKSRINFTYMQ